MSIDRVRIAELGPNGERAPLTDEGRAQRLKENREAYNQNCK